MLVPTRRAARRPASTGVLLGIVGALVTVGLVAALALPAIVQFLVVLPIALFAARLLATNRPAIPESGTVEQHVIARSDMALVFCLLFILVTPIPFLLGSSPGGIAVAVAALFLSIEAMHRHAWRRQPSRSR